MNFTKNYGTDPNYVGTQLKAVKFSEHTVKATYADNQILANGVNGGTKTLDHAATTMPEAVYTSATDKDFEQATALWKLLATQDGAQKRLVDNASAHIAGCTVKSLRDDVYGESLTRGNASC
jgi:catalase